MPSSWQPLAAVPHNSVDPPLLITIDQSDLEQFSQDIRKHLQVLFYCLEEGSWDVLYEAVQELLIPINREVECYTEALTFIRDQKVSQYLSPKVAQTITLCLNPKYWTKLVKLAVARFDTLPGST
jgi:hypothetical protein